MSSVDEFVNRTKQAGGKVVMPKEAVRGQGYVADTEGNVFGIARAFQNDPSVK